jgi:hypothetical protein
MITVNSGYSWPLQATWGAQRKQRHYNNREAILAIERECCAFIEESVKKLKGEYYARNRDKIRQYRRDK